jgi:hypothetical protein
MISNGSICSIILCGIVVDHDDWAHELLFACVVEDSSHRIYLHALHWPLLTNITTTGLKRFTLTLWHR